jgi:NAD(P)-dependent dehydrogenase (short-subunit alcohol dehydrogenase family)
VAFLPLDLGSLENVAKCTDNLKSYLGTKKIDILVNNAGIMALPNREVTLLFLLLVLVLLLTLVLTEFRDADSV